MKALIVLLLFFGSIFTAWTVEHRKSAEMEYARICALHIMPPTPAMRTLYYSWGDVEDATEYKTKIPCWIDYRQVWGESRVTGTGPLFQSADKPPKFSKNPKIGEMTKDGDGYWIYVGELHR